LPDAQQLVLQLQLCYFVLVLRPLTNAVQLVGQSLYRAGQFSDFALQFFDCVAVTLGVFNQQEKAPPHIQDVLPHGAGLRGGKYEAQALKNRACFFLEVINVRLIARNLLSSYVDASDTLSESGWQVRRFV
jgi:hypothetical protein